MKKTIKAMISAVLVLALFCAMFMLSGCRKPVMEKINSSGKLVAYCEAGFPPYEFMFKNELVGVDIEIVKAIAAELGAEADVHDVKFNAILGAVQSGKADLGISGITITEKRKKKLDFSIPYAKSEQCVIVPADQEIPTAEQLAGKKIGVQLGTTSDILVEGYINDGTMAGATLTQYNTPAEAAAAFGKIDVVVTDNLPAKIIVDASNGKYKYAKLVKNDGTDAAEVEEYGIAIAKGNEELLEKINAVIEKLKADGTIDNWISEYNQKATESDS